MRKALLGFAFVFALCLLPAATAHAQDAVPADGTIYLQAGAFDPLAQAGTAAAPADGGAGPYYLVQFAGPVEAAWLAQVAALGGAVAGYVPNNTHIVRLEADAVARVASLPGVRWVGPYRPAYKVAPELGATVAAAAAGGAGDALLELTVLLFPGESPDAPAALLAAQGATVLESAQTPIGPLLRVQAPPDAVPALAQQPAVAWVERYVEPVTANAEGRRIMGAEAVWQTLGYYGAGQIVAISDSGLSVQGALSADFGGRLLRAFTPAQMNGDSARCSAKTTFTDLNGHGTHVAGSVLGNGTLSGGSAAAHAYTSSHAGTAPEAGLVFMALNTDGTSAIQCADLNGGFVARGYEEGARISSNSWGANTGGGYNLYASLVDDYVWRHKDYLVLYSAGNSGPGPQTVGAPGTAKNVLTVGASENNRPDKGERGDAPDSVADFSSRGPAADGRIKPDIVAPGTWVLSVRAAQAPDGSFWGNFDQNYAFMGGTSMATPLAAGGAALVREWLGKARSLAAPSAALLKALLVNGATQLPGESAASLNSGHGRIDLKNTLGARYAVVDDHVQGLQTGDVVSYTVQVVAAGAQGTLLAFDGGAPTAQPSGALEAAAAPPVAASAALTTPGGLRAEGLPGHDQARPLAPIPDAASKAGLAPLDNAAPAPGGAPAAGAHFQPGSSAGLGLQNFKQHMVGGGDFEDPGWTQTWSAVWLGTGVPARTDDPAYVVAGDYSMWLGGTSLNDAVMYPVQFPATIDAAEPSGIAFDVRIVDDDPGLDVLCVALTDASGDYLGPFAPAQPQCVGQDGDWVYSYTFDAADRADLAGETAYLIVFTEGDGAAPHMSAFVDNVSLIVDFPPPTAAAAPASGPPGTTFLLTGKFNIPYGWIDICVSVCSPGNYIGGAWADAAGDLAAFLYSASDIAPGQYAIRTQNAAGRIADTLVTIAAAGQPTLGVSPASGPAGTAFAFSGTGFLPGDQKIALALNGAPVGSVAANAAGAIAFQFKSATNTAAGSYTMRATDSAGRSAQKSFTVTAPAAGSPKITVAPASGPPGTTFTFVASGFSGGQALASLDGQALGLVNVGAAGTLTLTLQTSASTAPAVYTLAVTQGAKRATAQYEVTAGSGAPASGQGLYVTLAWTDPPAQAAAGQTLVNDLDLTVDGPGNPVFPNGGAAADRKNNVEVVRIEKPAVGTYVITVEAERVNAAFGAQPFALVATSRQSFGAGQDDVDLGQPNAGTLRGVVFADADRDGVRDAGEAGLAGLAVTIRQAGGALQRQATTDAQGNYQAADLPAGSYTIAVALPPGYWLTIAAFNTTVGTGVSTAPAIGAAHTVYLPSVRR